MFDIGGWTDRAIDWATYEAPTANYIEKLTEYSIVILNGVPGMTQAHDRDFPRARPIFTLRDGTLVKTWKNPVGVDHIFLADVHGHMIFGGFVGWIHSGCLYEAIGRIHSECT